MVRWILFAAATCFLLIMTGCLEPSGTPRDPNSDDASRNEPEPAPKTPAPKTPAPGSPQPGPGNSGKPGSGNPGSPDSTTWALTLSLVAIRPGEADLYKDQVRPLLDRSCTAGGCHAVSSVIDLRVFPFPFDGSYTMEEVKARLGADYDQLEAQKIVVGELIEAVETDYMPPGGTDVPLVTPDELVPLREWLDTGLKIANSAISATLILTGTDGALQVCLLSRELKTDAETFTVESGACPGLKTLSWEILGRNNAVLSSGSWTRSELATMGSVRVEFSL